MKRLVRKVYGSAENAVYIDIIIEFAFLGEVIEGTDTLPPDKIILTDQEQADFEDFIYNIGGLINTFQFDIVEEHTSPYSKASQYYAFYPSDSDDELCYDKLYFVRISTHKRKSEKDIPFPKYYEKTAQQYKFPKSKKHQGYHVKQILVNNDYYESYEEAYDAIEKKFLNLQKKCDRLNGKG